MECAVKRVTVLGATGSIGCSTADIILRHPDKFSAHALVGYRNSEKMLQLAEQLNPDWVVMIDPDGLQYWKAKCRSAQDWHPVWMLRLSFALPLKRTW